MLIFVLLDKYDLHICSKKYKIVISFFDFFKQTDFSFVPDQLENGKYNLISV